MTEELKKQLKEIEAKRVLGMPLTFKETALWVIYQDELIAMQQEAVRNAG